MHQGVVARALLFVLLVAAGAAVAGCRNTSRYAPTYDRRLPRIRSVGICAKSVQVESRHTGGMREDRPDIAEDVCRRTLTALWQGLAEAGYAARVHVSPPGWPGNDPQAARAAALVDAVYQSIHDVHHDYGRSKHFEYTIGEAVGQLNDSNSDAVLCVYLQAAVPTGGRRALQVTAAVMGLAAVRVPFLVSASEADLTLMLIDGRSGEVLWCDHYRTITDVRKKLGLRLLVNGATKRLLEPRKR